MNYGWSYIALDAVPDGSVSSRRAIAQITEGLAAGGELLNLARERARRRGR